MNPKRCSALLGALTVALCLLVGSAGCSDDGKSPADTAASDTVSVSETVQGTQSPDSEAPETDAPDTTADSIAETDAPDTNAPDTNTPDTNAPDTNVPETNAPETEPETEPEPETKPAPKPIDPYNVALGQSITSTSTYSFGGSQDYIPQKLVDGIWEGVNGWIHDTSNHKTEDGNCDITITVTLDTVYSLQELILKPMDAFGGGGFPRAYELALSETGEDSDWTVVATETDKNVASAKEIVSYMLSEKMNVKFIRLHITKTGDDAYLSGDGYYAQLGEIEAIGVPVGTPENPVFATKNEELQYRMDQLLNTDGVIFDYCPEYDSTAYPGVKAMWIQGVQMGGKDTKFFAYVGFPAGASANDPVPGVVLVHGGAGTAFPEWVKLWNDKGYAAIAMCNVGLAPSVKGMPNPSPTNVNGCWRNYLTAEELAADSRILTPYNDDMRTSMGKLDQMWMYHAVSQTIICNTLLRSDPRVDADRVGITGISWGGVITSITMGYDDRFAFAIPVYGTGYLHESLGWIKSRFNAPGTAELWEPSLKLKEVDMPILWLGWANDTPFSINSFDKSFADTSDHAVMTFLQNQGHGYYEGWGPAEIYRFADSVVGNGQPLTTLKTQPRASHSISFEINKPADAKTVTAKVYYLTEPMTYAPDSDACRIQQRWQSVRATVSGTTVTAELPEKADNFYVEITTTTADGQKYITVSRYITIAD